MISPPSRAEGIASCSAFMLEAVGLNRQWELANNCSFCSGEDSSQEKFVSGCQHGVRRYDFRSCFRAFVYLPKYRFSLSAMEHRL